jgi:hypothetical protein
MEITSFKICYKIIQISMSLGNHGIKEDGVWEGKLGQILEVVLQYLAVEGFRKDV